jgi:hypothetical protein
MSVTRIGYLRPVGYNRKPAPAPIHMQPDNAQWGPALWRIFHALVEKSGRHTKPLLENEETRLWHSFLAHLRKSIPCSICRHHYSEYITGNNIEFPLSKDGLEKQKSLRKFFFDFHNEVNARTGKIFTGTESDLPSIYGSYTPEQFVADKAILLDNMNRAVQYAIIKRDDVIRTIRTLEELWLRFL